MKILFVCGYFEENAEKEVIENSKKTVQFSSNLFQQKLINAFTELGKNFYVLSAPFLGSYPNESKIKRFNGFSKECIYDYVHFNNIWGIRNFSRTCSLKKKMDSFINCKDEDKVLIVYSVHTPFLEAAVYAKEKDPRIKIALIVPDLPEYMNLNAHISLLYKIGKKLDIYRFNKLNKHVDSYMLLTEKMRDKLNVGVRPYIIVEGLVEEKDIIESEELSFPNNSNSNTKGLKYIVYTGKMNEKFGVKDLIEAFLMLKNENYRLILCGSGDCNEYIKKRSAFDSRIQMLGQVSPEESHNWQQSADVLVNPRPNEGEFVKYSFPSKNIEYLLTGKPVVAYLLDGMPREYKDFIYCIKENKCKAKAICDALKDAMSATNAKQNPAYYKYVREKLDAHEVAKQIVGTLC